MNSKRVLVTGWQKVGAGSHAYKDSSCASASAKLNIQSPAAAAFVHQCEITYRLMRCEAARLGLRELVVVVREAQVLAAGVDVQPRADHAARHGRALDVPPCGGASHGPLLLFKH